MNPELVLLKAFKRSPITAWIPCYDPYTLGGYTFTSREWVFLTRDLHRRGYLEKFVKTDPISHHKGFQKILTCFRLTEKGRKALEELGL